MPDTQETNSGGGGGGGGGDVVGPGSATDEALCRYNGGSGTSIQSSVVTLSDQGLFTNTGTGTAITAGAFQFGLDADATQQWHLNFPSNKSFEISEQDQQVATFNGLGLGIGIVPTSPLHITYPSNAGLLAQFDPSSLSVNDVFLNLRYTAGPLTGQLYTMDATFGADAGITIYQQNTVTGSTTAHSSVSLVTQDPTSGDPRTQYIINGVTTFTAGIDNSDSDTFTPPKLPSAGSLQFLIVHSNLPAGSSVYRM
jgi:hypothetical protein